MNFSYYFFLICLSIFGSLFFTYDLFIDKIKELKSNQLLYQSSVYLNSSIDNAGGLLENGVNKARIAYLLNPDNADALLTYLNLLYRTDSVKALVEWSFAPLVKESELEKSSLLKKCLHTMQNDDLTSEQRKMTASIALKLADELIRSVQWTNNPSNSLLISELLGEVGHPLKALERVRSIIKDNPEYPDAIFLATRLVVHLRDTSKVVEISRALAGLSSRRNEIGIEAIRHMTLLNLLEPLSPSALKRCTELLISNPTSKPIDFLRIYALLFAKTNDVQEKNSIITECSQLFDLNDRDELLVFANWLGQLKAFEHLAFFLPASKAKVDEELFKLRMSALAQLGDIERISQEINNAPIIPLVWRLVVEARALSLGAKFEESRKTLNRLLPLIEEDPRKVRSICIYLESVNDITNLSHILEKLIEKPLHQKYALGKLLQHRSASTGLEDLLLWLSKLKDMRKQDPKLENAYLYLRLLDKRLVPSSKILIELLDDAIKLNRSHPDDHSQISLALAHLRNEDPSKALVALGKPEDWRKWSATRPAWSYIASEIYSQNHDSEKALILRKKINFNEMDQAERQSLKALFPDSLKPSDD